MTPWSATCQAPLISTIFQSLLKFTSIESVMLTSWLSAPSFAFSLSHHQGFPNESDDQSIWSFTFNISLSNEYQGLFLLGFTDLISLQSKGLLGVFSSTTIWKHQFFSIQSSLWTNSHIHTCLLEIKLRFSNWGKTVEWMSKQGTNTLLPYLYIQFYSNKTYFHFWISVQQNFLS